MRVILCPPLPMLLLLMMMLPVPPTVVVVDVVMAPTPSPDPDPDPDPSPDPPEWLSLLLLPFVLGRFILVLHKFKYLMLLFIHAV